MATITPRYKEIKGAQVTQVVQKWIDPKYKFGNKLSTKVVRALKDNPRTKDLISGKAVVSRVQGEKRLADIKEVLLEKGMHVQGYKYQTGGRLSAYKIRQDALRDFRGLEKQAEEAKKPKEKLAPIKSRRVLARLRTKDECLRGSGGKEEPPKKKKKEAIGTQLAGSNLAGSQARKQKSSVVMPAGKVSENKASPEAESQNVTDKEVKMPSRKEVREVEEVGGVPIE